MADAGAMPADPLSTDSRLSGLLKNDAAPPKVLVIGPLPPPEFGVARATRLMLDSSVLAARVRLTHLDTSDARGVANIGLLDWRNVLLGVKHLAQLVGLLARKRPQVVMLTVSQGLFGLVRDALLVCAARAFRAKVVAYLRGSGYAEVRIKEGWIAGYLLRFILRASSRTIVLGGGLVAMAHAVCPKTRVAVVPNGCPPAVPADQAGLRDESRPLLAYIGRLAVVKGIENAVRAACIVVDAVPDLEFDLCGEWENPADEAKMEGLVRDLGLSDHVSFPGAVAGQEKEALLARAWVLVLPSYSEGHPWVILEAMSAGVPVVATNTGAIPETVEDGVTGYVVPVGDDKALAARVTELLRDHDLWTRMSREALRRYRDHFTVERSHSALADELCRVARSE